MDPDQTVVLTVVSSESEAEVVCGLLRSAGIECAYRDTEAIESSLEDFTAAGPREILGHAEDMDYARARLTRKALLRRKRPPVSPRVRERGRPPTWPAGLDPTPTVVRWSLPLP